MCSRSSAPSDSQAWNRHDNSYIFFLFVLQPAQRRHDTPFYTNPPQQFIIYHLKRNLHVGSVEATCSNYAHVEERVNIFSDPHESHPVADLKYYGAIMGYSNVAAAGRSR